MSIICIPNTGDLHKVLERVLSPYLGNLDLSKGVFLKPNIVFPVRPSTGEITNPLLVAALIGVLRDIKPDVDIVIGEGTAAGTNPTENFRVSGYEQMARMLKVPLVDLDQCERVPILWARGELHIPGETLNRVYINLPILKVSSAATMSGAMKNQKGLLTPYMKKKFHRMDLHRPIAELAKVVVPDLTIMDTSSFFHQHALLAGENTFELDHFLCERLNIPKPEYLNVAAKIGVGGSTYTVQTELDLDPRRVSWEEDEYRKIMNLRLWSNSRACSMCRLNFHELRDFRVAATPRLIGMYAKLLKCSLKGTDIIFGSRPNFIDSGNRIVCVGDCTAQLARDNGYEHISGCPPTSKKIFESL